MKKRFFKILSIIVSLSLLFPTISMHALSENCSESIQSVNSLFYNPALFKAWRTTYSGYESHYATNTALESNLNGSLITSQSTCPQFLIGKSTMALVGCEVAAVYNALRLRGNSNWYRSVSNIIRTFEQSGYIMKNGDFGTDPFAIGEYFESEEINFSKYTSFSSMKNRVDTTMKTSNQVYIVSFWNNSSTIADGLHTIAFYASKDLGKITIYNNGNQTSASSFEEIDGLTDVTFIVGYCVTKGSRSVD